MSRARIWAIALTVGLSGCGGDDGDSPSAATGPLAITCSATPTSGAVPLTVQFTANVTSPEESTPTLTWSFGDGTAASVASASRTYLNPGTYTAGAEVRAGGRSSTCSVTVTASAPPRVTLGPNGVPVARFKITPNPPSGNVPLTVDFNACQSSDPEGDRLLFRFDVFDGLYDSLHCRREHTYRTQGTFTTKICVTDDFPGHADICQSYTVTAK